MTAFVEQLSELADWSGESMPRGTGEKTGAKDAQQACREKDLSGLADRVARNSRLALLTRVVESEVLPRLALARGALSKDVAAHNAPSATNLMMNAPELSLCTTTKEEDTTELVRLLLKREAVDAVGFVELLRERGATPEALFLGVISHAARVLGEMWEDDRCDFTQVTIGTGRLQQIVRALSPGFQAAAVRRSQPESVLLLPAPGEQHTFGLVLLGEFFCRAGWHVAGGPAMVGREAAEVVRSTWFNIVGFSVGSDLRMDQLAQTIHSVRRASRNRDIGIMVGGPLYLSHPEFVARVGADTGALDAVSAVQQAFALVALRAVAD